MQWKTCTRVSSVIIDSSINPKAQHATGYSQAGGSGSISPLKVSDCYGYESNKTFMSASSEASQQKKAEQSDFCDMTSILRIFKFIFLGEVTLMCEIFFFSSRSLKTREKYISFAQFVYFLKEMCLLFNGEFYHSKIKK